MGVRSIINYIASKVPGANKIPVAESDGKLAGSWIDELTALSTVQFELNPTTTHSEGQMHWNNVDRTLEVDMAVEDVALQLGQEQHLRAYNATGSEIANGRIVYVSGSTGMTPEVSLAKADAFTTSHCTLAVSTHAVPNGTIGYFTTFGLARGYNTSAFTEGQEVYLSATAAGRGALVRPSGANHPVRVGFCVVSDATDGTILVNIRPETFQTLRVGGDANYSVFEADGTLKFNGDASVWKDINLGGVNLTRATSRQPDLVNVDSTSVLAYAFDGGSSEEELHGGFEIQHDYKEGTDLVFHLHWYPTTADSGDVKWVLDYYIRSGDTLKLTNTVSVVSAATGTAWEEIRADFPTVDGADIVIGSQVHLRLSRDPTDTEDTYEHDAALGTVGTHHQSDTVGSRQIIAK